MTRAASVIVLIAGLVLVWGFPLTPVAAAPGFAWGAAELVETNNAGDARGPQVAVDPQGNATAVWHQSNGTRFDIWANHFVLGVGWGTAELIETNAGDALFPQVGMDEAGNAVAVWSQFDGTRNNIWANRFVPGIGWGTAELIETDDGGDAGGTIFGPGVDVAVDPLGNGTAVWQQFDGTRQNIMANRFVPGLGWGTAKLIEADDACCLAIPRVAVDPQGNAVAVWRHSDGIGTDIMANRFVSGVGWGTEELIETHGALANLPQVAMDAGGNAVAVWQQGIPTEDIWANRFIPAVGWGTPEVIETDEAGSAVSPQVVMDPAGNAIAVWGQFDGISSADIMANRFVPGVGWGTPELIETDAGSAGSPHIAMDPAGNAVAVWWQVVGPHLSAEANHFALGVGWGTAELIETDGPPGVAGSVGPEGPQVAMDAAGNAVAVWSQNTDLHGDIWANRFAEGFLVPTAPQNPHADDGGDPDRVRVQLSWTPPSDDGGSPITTYNLYRGITSGNLTLLAVLSSGQLGYEDSGVTSGQTYYYQVSAVNSVGEGPRSTEVSATPVDGKGPTITITSPADGAALNSISVVVSGTASDNEAVGKVELSLDGTIYVLATGTTMWSGPLTLAEGSNTIFVRATDNAGNAAILSIAVTVDTVNPTISISFPVDGSALPSTSVTVSGTASDDIAVEKVELSTDGTTWILATGTASWSASLILDEGDNTVLARTTDTSGNTATLSIGVTVDAIKPQAVAGEDRTVDAGEAVSFDARVSSDNVAIVSYEWDFGDGSTGTGETVTHIYTDAGTYTVTLTVRDAAGNVDTYMLTVTVATEPVNPISPEVVTLAVIGVVAAGAVGLALLLWRRRAGGKEKL